MADFDPRIGRIVLSRNRVKSGQQVEGRVVLDDPASVDRTFQITSDLFLVTSIQPATVTVLAGEKESNKFTISTMTHTRSNLGFVYGNEGTKSIKKARLFLSRQMSAGIVGSISIVNPILNSGGSTTGTVTVSVVTPGLTVNLTSNAPSIASVPSSVGFSSGTVVSDPFVINAGSTIGLATISATTTAGSPLDDQDVTVS